MKNKTTTLGTVFCGMSILLSYSFAQDVDANALGKAAIGEVAGNEIRMQWHERDSVILSQICEKYIPESGFTPLLVWTGEQWSNLSGGKSAGTTWDSLLTFGFEQNLESATKIKGLGSLGLSAFYYTQTGDFSAGKVGAASDPSNIFSGDMVRVFEIYYHNELETQYGTLCTRIGQLAADEDFMGTDYSDIFLNSNFGAIVANCGDTLANGANAFSQYSLATFGATLSWTRENVDAKLGVYNGNCGEDLSNNHGFDYSLENVALWYQVGLNYSVSDLSGRVVVGGNFHNGKFTNYYSGGEERNFYSFYLTLQQDFLNDGDGNAILGGFLRAAYAPDESIAACTKYFDCGLNWFAPIPSRESDVLALGYSIMEAGRGVRFSESSSQFENMLELTYRAQLTGAISFQPTFQTYFNAKDENGETDAAFVIGARVEVNF